MFDLLIEKYSKFRNVKVVNADILKFDLEKNMKTNTIIFGNLPYNISSQILVKLIKFETGLKIFKFNFNVSKGTWRKNNR